MAFNDLKSQHGTRVIQAVAIYPNACKYSVDETINNGLCESQQIVNSSYAGALSVTENAGADILFLQNGNPYVKTNSGEIAKVTVDSNSQITLVSRGQFGTVASTIAVGEQLRIIHGGEADGSCRGYPQRPDGKGCSSADSFDREVTRKFLFTDIQLVAGEIYYNGLKSISHSPVLLKPGEAMAKNAGVTVTIQDNEDGDQYAVPYPSQRSNLSTLLRRLNARVGGYLRNRKMITYSGFSENSSFDEANCIAREYVIDSFNISDDDSVTITGKDPLILSEESKSKAPQVSAGVLLADITNASTEITLKNFLIGEYGNDTDTGTVNIDSELIDYTVTDSVAGVLAINARGVAGSEQKDHKINASVQWVLTRENFNPIEFIVDLLQDYTNIEPRFFGDYTSAINAVQSSVGKVYINKSESVSKLINEIIQSWAENNIAIYFDEVAQQIRIKASGDFSQQPVTITDTSIKRDTIRIDSGDRDQVTRAAIGFAPFDASKKTNDENSSVIYQSINIGLELTGTLEPQEAKTFYSRFLTDSDTDVSIAVGGIGRVANVNLKPPKTYTFTVDYESVGAVDGGLVEEGEIINLTTETNIDDDGLPMSENLQILSIKDNPDNKTATLKARLYQDIVNQADFDFIIDENKENYVLSDDFAPAAGSYKVFVSSNVTIGATSTASFAFDTGTQAVGVELEIIVRGQILGAGGSGANGGFALATNPDDAPMRAESQSFAGNNGGDAINLTVPTVLDLTQGLSYAGGGGAPSAKSIADSTVSPVFVDGGNGGSGGQGYVGGAGGVGGQAVVEDTASDTGLNGVSGSRSSAGSLGGISGGAWGEDGETSAGLALGGESGFAIRSNGNLVTIIGDNSATIRGKRDF